MPAPDKLPPFPIDLASILIFLVPFVAAILIDLLSHKSGKEISMADALKWSIIWVVCSALFGGYVWWRMHVEYGDVVGWGSAWLYTTGYALEKALAVDNLFAFYLIFKSFGLTAPGKNHLQHRILYWGILGAIVFRLIFLSLGAFVLSLGSFVLIFFALIVLWTVWKMWTSGDSHEEIDYTQHWSVNLVKRVAKINPSIESERFFKHGVTPLFLCLICIEACDVVFAFDSMPVIVAVVRDPYLMITSSLWAAAGLRSLYFLLVAAQNKFWALDKAVMSLLVFVAFKLLLGGVSELFTGKAIHIPPAISLSIILVILAAGVIASLTMKPKAAKEIEG